MSRTRVKFCGLTRAEDVAAAVAAGADAVGFVCYAKSARYVAPATLERLARGVPPFVTPVLLFVDADLATIAAIVARVPHALLQFHGSQSARFCESAARPYLRAIAMAGSVDLLDCEREFGSALAIMADAPSAGHGGSGERFDWALVPDPSRRQKPLVLAGGLNEANVAAAITAVRPFAVDVSSGVESAPGMKSADKMHRFMAAVRAADLSLAGA